jgi:hypothetical protein
MERMQKVVKSNKQPDGFVDGFLSVQGGHDELYIHPEKYTGAAEKMLTAMEQKQTGKNQIPPDLVVKFQPIDIVHIILWQTMRLSVVYTQEIKD